MGQPGKLCGVLGRPPPVRGIATAACVEIAYYVGISSKVPPPVLQILVDGMARLRVLFMMYWKDSCFRRGRVVGVGDSPGPGV